MASSPAEMIGLAGVGVPDVSGAIVELFGMNFDMPFFSRARAAFKF